MAEMHDLLVHDVLIKVISQKGECRRGHKVGDEWVMRNSKTPEGICLSAFQPMIPNARLLMCGGSLPWAPHPDVSIICCPDPNNLVIFELRRLRK